MSNAATPVSPSPGEASTGATITDKPEPAKTTAPSAPPAPPHGSPTSTPQTRAAADATEQAATKKSAAKKAAKKASAKKTAKKAASKPAATEAPEARSAAEIQSDIDAAQARLASRVDELSDRLHPQTLAEDAMGNVKRAFVYQDGSPKKKPIAIVAGGLGALLVLRKIFHRN